MIKSTILVVLFYLSIYGFLNQNSAFRAFFWTMDEKDTAKSGCYGYNQIDSVASLSNEYKHFSSFWLTYDWWHLRFKMSYMPTEVTFSKSRPPAVTKASEHFSNVEWFTGFKRSSSSDSISFYFPLLPLTEHYGRYDYFTVDIDSILEIQFYGAGDSIMVGTFVDKRGNDRGGTLLLGRDAFIVELSDANPLRVGSIRCQGAFDSLITLYLKFPLDSLKKSATWYGVDILDTLSNVPKIKVYSVGLSGKIPCLLGSKKNITWKLSGQGEIDSCLVTVAYDKMTWIPLGKTIIDTFFNWIIPEQASDSTIIKVIAYGKHGERIASSKENLSFFTFNIRSLQVY
jgi:hypothetical protein